MATDSARFGDPLVCTDTRYTVLERLGQGGTATVHRAIEHGVSGGRREVAIKRLYPHLAEDEEYVRAFVREADLAARLRHPNIVRIHTLGRGATGYFISMELVRGPDLRRLIARLSKRRITPPIDVVLTILWQLCDALDYAHLRLVHRDVSPSNLLLAPSGQLKIIDFGIARAAASDLETHTGVVRGKYGYMSPEALRAEPLDLRADLFSAGVIVHELLTMEPLFAGPTDLDTMSRVMRAQVPAPSATNRSVPPELDALVLKALERDPSDRFQTAAEMRKALTAVRLAHAPHATARRTGRWVWSHGATPGTSPAVPWVVSDR